MLKITFKMLKLQPRPASVHLGSGHKFYERLINISKHCQKSPTTLMACQVTFP